MERVAIVGWAQKQFERTDLGYSELVYEVVKDLPDYDTIVSASSDFYDGRTISNMSIQDVIRAPRKSESKVSMDGAFAMMYGWMRVASGEYDTCLVVAHSKLSEGDPRAIARAGWNPLYLRPLDLDDHAALGMQARACGFSDAALAEAAATSLKVSVDHVLASPIVADPLRRLMLAPDSDGAAAVLLASEAVAHKYSRTPIWIRGMGACYDAHSPGHRDLRESKALRSAAKQAVDRAGIREFDVAEVHDLSAAQKLLWMQELGLRRCNESGGALKSQPGFATGLIRVIEVAHRLAVGAGRTGLAHGMTGPLGQAQCVWVLST